MAKHYVGVADPRLVYVLLEDRAEFDLIGVPATEVQDERRHMLFKSVEQGGVRVVFQHWLYLEKPKAKT